MTIFNCCNNCCEIEVIQYIDKRPSRHKRRLPQKAGIFIFDYKLQKVLLVQSRGNLWGIPKGTFEEGETSLECAIREVKEETGLDIDKDNLHKLYVIKKNAFYYFLNMKETTVTIQSGIENNDVNGIGWIKIECLKELVRLKTMKLNHHAKLCFQHFLNLEFN